MNNRKLDLYNFLKALAIGFGVISIGIAIAVVGFILVAKK